MRCDASRTALGALLLFAALGCGSSTEKLGKPPAKFVRPAPMLAAANPPDASVDADTSPGTFQITGDAGVTCCDQTFSFPATSDGESRVTVRGDGPLLSSEGLQLTKKNGVWTGHLCLPPDQTGIYYYELAFPPQQSDGSAVADAGGAYFHDERYNPDEPTTESSLWGTVNAFVPKDSNCK